MNDLIKDLEQATGPSRELDDRIGTAIGLYIERLSDGTLLYQRKDHKMWPEVPHYTASLDAALTLVPEGWEWQISTRAPDPHSGRTYLHNGELQMIGAGITRNPAYRGVENTAYTPALALCIAALRAREAQKEEVA